MSDQSCYWPDGSNADGDLLACSAFAQDGSSSCCWFEDICTSNGYCIDTFAATFYRGGCTDSSWSSSACAQNCLSTSNDTYLPVTACAEDMFACGYANDAAGVCNGTVTGDTFDISADSPLAFQVLNDPSLISSFQGYPTSVTVVNGAAASSTVALNTAGPTTIVKTAAAPTVTAHTTSIAHTTSVVTDKDTTTTAVVGGVLGGLLAVALLAIAALAILLLQAKRRLREQGSGLSEPKLAAYQSGSQSSSGQAPVEAPGDYTYNRMETDGER